MLLEVLLISLLLSPKPRGIYKFSAIWYNRIIHTKEELSQEMDINGLKYFLKVAQCLNFTRAAEECFITQTAMSQHIANMEKELGFQLFVRNKRKVELTVAGHNFYNHISRLIENYETAVSSSQSLASGATGSVVVAVTSCIESLILMFRIRHFKTQYPSLQMSMITIRPCEMVEYLQRGKCDLAIGVPHDMAEVRGIEVHILGSFKPYVVCPGNHPLAGNKRITPEMLSGHSIALLDLRNMPATLKQMHYDMDQMGLHDFQNMVTFEQIERMEDLLFMSLVTSRLSIVPEFAIGYAEGDLTLLELDSPKAVTLPLGIGYMADNSNPVLSLALDVIRDSRIPLNY